MRTYARLLNSQGNLVWAEVSTDANGYNDLVWLVTLIQVLRLNLNESPFYATYGIPAQQSVLQQVYPDYYVFLTQQLFAQYFVSLQIIKQPATTPTYNIYVITHSGFIFNETISILTTELGAPIITSGGAEIIV